MIAGILLAAGRSERFGSDKRLREINGRPLIYYSLRACIESTLRSIFVVVETSRTQTANLVENLFPRNPKIRVIENPLAIRGQMSSVKAGLRALPPDVNGAMIVLADMPLITPELIDRLTRVFDERGTVVVPESGGTQYHPRILPRSLFPQFLALDDSEKGTGVLGALGDQITTVRVPDRNLFRDVDKPGDLIGVTRRLALVR